MRVEYERWKWIQHLVGQVKTRAADLEDDVMAHMSGPKMQVLVHGILKISIILLALTSVKLVYIMHGVNGASSHLAA